MAEPRIISLIASATEIVCALGFESQMVGRSHECDFPASVKRLPVCTSPKFEVEGLSYEIDERVKAILQEALSVYRVDADLLEQLRPTHIITSRNARSARSASRTSSRPYASSQVRSPSSSRSNRTRWPTYGRTFVAWQWP